MPSNPSVVPAPPLLSECVRNPSQQRELITTFMISFNVIVNVWFSQSREQKLILGLVELLCDPGRGSFPHTVLRWIKIHLQACAVAGSRTRVRLCPNRSTKQRHTRLLRSRSVNLITTVVNDQNHRVRRRFRYMHR